MVSVIVGTLLFRDVYVWSGRFLLGVLTDLKIWYQSQSLYEQDNNTKVGPLPGMQLSLKKGGVYEPWTSFKTLVNKWYKKLVKVRQGSSNYATISKRR